MRTIALRFGENIAPSEGTIAAHQKMIQKNGFVWYGKFGNSVSLKVANDILKNETPKILLIQSGSNKRYWAYIDAIQRSKPKEGEYPAYYNSVIDRFKTWFKVMAIEDAPKNIMSHCFVASSGVVLSYASRSSISPYFIIDTE